MNALTKPDPVGVLLEAQADCARIDQLIAAGVPRREIAAAVRQKKWLSVSRRVVVTGRGPLSRSQKEWAAVLGSGPNAALAGRSAATRQGLAGWEDDDIHVIVRRGTKVPASSFPIRVHESRRFSPDTDLHPIRNPAMTRFERSIIDAASWMSHPRTACGLAITAIQQRHTTAASLLAELDQASNMRHRGILRPALHDVAGGTRALSEIDFRRLCLRHNLPAPTRQTIRHDNNGRRRYIDVELRSRRGKRWLVEVDAGLHLIVGSYWRGTARASDLIVRGSSVIRFPSIALYLDEPAVAAQLHRALRD